MAGLIVTRYSFPSTSDKQDDETWVASSERKGHETHGDSRWSLSCRNEEGLKPHARRWREFLAVEHEEIDPGDDLLPTRPAS
jgi:hypothetical protein